MKKEIAFFRQAIQVMDQYAGTLSGVAQRVSNPAPLPDLLQQQLAHPTTGSVPPDTAEVLRGAATRVLQISRNVQAFLAQANVVMALVEIDTAANGIDRLLDEKLMLRAPGTPMLPMMSEVMAPVRADEAVLFPTTLEGPLRTPEIEAFERHLKSVENPWS